MNTSNLPVVRTVADLRTITNTARQEGKRVGAVFTMGALHLGHASLIDRARSECDLVAVTVFVNPTQFGPNEDLDAYPRTLEADLELAGAHGADVVFAPTVSEIYPGGLEQQHTSVHISDLGEYLCGASRPGHFDGVATVVTKLFAILGPCTAYFGQKDAQQLAIITELVRALHLEVQVVGCPIIRESDGLAMSSRNRYLSPEDRNAAAGISQALFAAADRCVSGERNASVMLQTVRDRIEQIPGASIDYGELVDANTMHPISSLDRAAVLAVAVRIGGARLIDNVRLTPTRDGVDVERGRNIPASGPVG